MVEEGEEDMMEEVAARAELGTGAGSRHTHRAAAVSPGDGRR